jgi:hypothetical protein
MRGPGGRAFSLVAALAAMAVLLVAQSPSASASTAALKRIHDPGKVTYSIHIRSCHARDGGKLPDPACTPGSIDPAVTQQNIRSTICKSGYTARVRPPESQTEYAKYHVAYPAYHIKDSAVSELDHLVPLELGGSNDITNLWPEVGKQPNPKDTVESVLNRAVCDRKVSLAAAQNAIASDWMTAEARLGLTHQQAWCTASAAYNSTYGDYDVYVHSNQPYKTATAKSSIDTWHYETNGSGYADIYLYANRGGRIAVTVGAASCSATANLQDSCPERSGLAPGA